MAIKRNGSCLCGAVTFSVEGDFDAFFLCHCSRCRKGTGSAHAANLFSNSAQVSWLSGADMVQRFDLPDTRHSRSFCGTCGCAVPLVTPGTSMIVVPAGCLDDAVNMPPNAHISIESRADWDDKLETLPKLDGMPGA